MDKYDVIVVGAGSGGNVGALTLQKSGMKTLLLEKHNITGGTGSSFRRGRFEFETALHQLYGISDNPDGTPGRLREVFEELGIYDKLEFVHQSETFRLTMGDKLSVAFPGTYEGFKAVCKKVSPQEADAVDAYQELCDKVGREFYDMYKAISENAPITKERFPYIFEYGPLSTAEVLSRYFKHPLLIGAYSTYYGYIGIPVETCPFINMALPYYRGEGTCYPRGGSAMMSGAITDEFLKCGGKLKLEKDVDHIYVEDNQVKGVHCTDGSVYYADKVLCGCSKIRTYIDLLDEKDVPEQVFDDLRVSVPSQSIFVVYMGLDISAEEAGIQSETNFCRAVTDPNKTMRGRYEVVMNSDDVQGMEFSCYNVDIPDASPEGTCMLSVLFSKVPDWILAGPIEEYYDRKDAYLAKALDFIYEYFPKVKGHIEEIDCATPVTLMRYLGSQKGSIYGIDAFMKDYIANKLDVDSPIHGLYFCGASILSGGFNTSMIGGYSVAKRIVHDEGRSQ